MLTTCTVIKNTEAKISINILYSSIPLSSPLNIQCRKKNIPLSAPSEVQVIKWLKIVLACGVSNTIIIKIELPGCSSNHKLSSNIFLSQIISNAL